MSTANSITRIVKMTFEQKHIDAFLYHFDEKKEYIRAFPGCNGLKLIRCIEQPNILFTYSKWENASALDSYRHSELFKTTWAYVKTLFQERAEAWSTSVVDSL